MTEQELQGLERLAKRMCDLEGSIAHALATGESTRALSDNALRAQFGVDRLGLARLRMCKLPRNQRGLEQVATYTGAYPIALAQLVAEGGAL